VEEVGLVQVPPQRRGARQPRRRVRELGLHPEDGGRDRVTPIGSGIPGTQASVKRRDEGSFVP
jgi:hypothetical protein